MKTPKQMMRDTRPPQRRHLLSQQEHGKEGDYAVRHRRGRLHETIVGPRQHQDVGDEEGKQRSHTQPDRRVTEDGADDMSEIGGRGNRGGAHALHALAQHHVSQRTRNNHDQDHHESLEMESVVRIHQAPAARRERQDKVNP